MIRQITHNNISLRVERLSRTANGRNDSYLNGHEITLLPFLWIDSASVSLKITMEPSLSLWFDLTPFFLHPTFSRLVSKEDNIYDREHQKTVESSTVVH